MNNEKIKELALKHGFKLEEQKSGEMNLNEYVYAFAWDLIQQGKAKLSHKEYLANFLEDASQCVPDKSIGYSVSIYCNDVSKHEPCITWRFYNGVDHDNFTCRIPDSREMLNQVLNNAKGCMKSACYRAMNPNFDKE